MLLHSDMGFAGEETAIVSPRMPLRPIRTKPVKSAPAAADVEDGDCSSAATTPTTEGSRIPETLPCPSAPKKRKPTLRCSGPIEFFSPPDLETVFMRRPEGAK